jgi:hypothetical protein
MVAVINLLSLCYTFSFPIQYYRKPCGANIWVQLADGLFRCSGEYGLLQFPNESVFCFVYRFSASLLENWFSLATS